MSDEGFLKRWSRRKRAETPPPAHDAESAERPPSNLPSQAEEGLSAPPPRSGEGQEGVPQQARGPQEKPDDEAVDPASLPPLESLGPDSDYTVFLKKGVPEALRIAALRKAWVSDPFIRDFRGPAEYALDYTSAEFELRPTDDVAGMLDRIFPQQPTQSESAGGAQADTPSAPAVREPSAPAIGANPAPSDLNLPQKQADARPLKTEPAGPQIAQKVRRKHGGAMPDEGN